MNNYELHYNGEYLKFKEHMVLYVIPYGKVFYNSSFDHNIKEIAKKEDLKKFKYIIVDNTSSKHNYEHQYRFVQIPIVEGRMLLTHPTYVDVYSLPKEIQELMDNIYYDFFYKRKDTKNHMNGDKVYRFKLFKKKRDEIMKIYNYEKVVSTNKKVKHLKEKLRKKSRTIRSLNGNKEQYENDLNKIKQDLKNISFENTNKKNEIINLKTSIRNINTDLSTMMNRLKVKEQENESLVYTLSDYKEKYGGLLAQVESLKKQLYAETKVRESDEANERIEKKLDILLEHFNSKK